MSGPIDEFLVEVSQGIEEVDAVVLQEALAEMRGHLEESAAGYVELGEDREAAERMAVLAFGSREVAKKAMPQPPRILDWSVLPLSWFWGGAVLAHVILLLLMINFSLPDGWVWIPFVLAFVLAARGFVRRRFELIRLPSVMMATWVIGILLIAPAFRVSSWGDVILAKEAVQKRNELVQQENLFWARTQENNRIFQQVLDGNAEATVGATKAGTGYLLPPRSNTWPERERERSPDLESAISAWNREASKIDLRFRIQSAEQAHATTMASLAELDNSNYSQVAKKMVMQTANGQLMVLYILMFCNGFGVLVRLFGEMIHRLVSSLNRSIRG